MISSIIEGSLFLTYIHSLRDVNNSNLHCSIQYTHSLIFNYLTIPFADKYPKPKSCCISAIEIQCHLCPEDFSLKHSFHATNMKLDFLSELKNTSDPLIPYTSYFTSQAGHVRHISLVNRGSNTPTLINFFNSMQRRANWIFNDIISPPNSSSLRCRVMEQSLFDRIFHRSFSNELALIITPLITSLR